MSGHTPGPWSANRLIVSSAGKVPEPVAMMALNGGRGDEAQANARLIAAAPDLLEAGKLIYEQLYGPPMTWADQVKWETAAEALRAAISKAEGR